MNVSKIIKILLVVFFVFVIIASVIGFKHNNKKKSSSYATHNLKNDELRFYEADLDHDGVIGEREKRLTWKESYDELLRQSNDLEELKKIADKMNISKEIPVEQRIELARNEILHQAEDLLLSTGCVIPLYNSKHLFQVKDYLKGVEHNVYRDSIFDNAYRTDGKDEINVVVGQEPRTLDPCLIGEVQSATIIENCLRSICFRPNDKEERHELGIIIQSNEDKNVILDIYIGNFELIDSKKDKNDINNYKFIDFAYWDDGQKVTAKNLIWTINRLASPVTGAPFSFFVENIVGYDEWYNSEKERIKKSGEINKTVSFYNGMSGIKETTGAKNISDFKGNSGTEAIQSIRIEVKNNPFFLKEGLKQSALSILPVHRMTKNTGQKDEEIIPDWWRYSSSNSKDGCYLCCNGPFKIETIEIQNNGKIIFVKNDKYAKKDKIKLKKITFRFVSSENVAVNDFENGKIDFNTIISKIQVNDKIKEGGLQTIDLPSSKYLFFNVNDDAFDSMIHEDDTPFDAEKKRQNMRYILALLIDKNKICDELEKGFASPSRGVVSNKIIENVIPKRNSNNEIIVSEEKGVNWCDRNSCVLGEYNRFEKRSFNDDKELFSIYRGKPEDKDYNENIINLKEKNIKKAMKLADEINLKYSYNNGDLRFEDFPKLTILVNGGEKTNIFEHIQNYYKNFNINLQIDAREFNYLCNLTNTGNFSIFCIGYSADFMDPATFLSLFTSNHVNNFCQLGKNKSHNSYNVRSKNAIKGFKK